MSVRYVEFIGGPNDGECCVDPGPEWRVYLPAIIYPFASSAIPDTIPPPRIGLYRLKDGAMHWMGEQ